MTLEYNVIYHSIISGCSNNNLSGGRFQTTCLLTCHECPRERYGWLYSTPCCVRFGLMSAEQTPAILSWIKEVARSVRKSPPNTHRFKKSVGNRTSPPLTPASKHKRKRSVPGAENLISQSDPSKRTRHPAFGTPDDIIALAISSPTTSQGERARPSSPSRVKAELAAASPRVVYIHESADPTSLAASQLLAILTQDSEFHDIHDVARKVSNASCQCAFELRSKGSWVNKVALPLLEGAIGELPLKCWSVYVSRRLRVFLPLGNF